MRETFGDHLVVFVWVRVAAHSCVSNIGAPRALIVKDSFKVNRSNRQLAAVRQAQTQTPLTPMSMSAPPPPQETICPICAGKITAEILEARYFVRCAERDRDGAEKKLLEERAAMQTRYAEMLSKIEGLEQRIVAITALDRDFNKVDTAQVRKAAALADVKDGKLCTNSAMPAEEAKQFAEQQIEKGIMICQSQTTK